MAEPQLTRLPTRVILLFAISFPLGLVFAPALADEAVRHFRMVRAEGVVVETRVAYDPTPSKAPGKWCKEWLVDYRAGRQWFHVRRYLNEQDAEVAGDIGRTKTVWYDADGAMGTPPEPELKAVQAAFAGGFGVVGLIAIGALVQRLMGWERMSGGDERAAP